MPTAAIRDAKAKAMSTANTKCAALIALYKKGTLERVPGRDLELSLEQTIGKECTCFRRHGDVCACGRASAVKALGARSKLARELAACTRFLRASAAQDEKLPDPWTTSSAMLGH